jgi:hypothetical protein
MEDIETDTNAEKSRLLEGMYLLDPKPMAFGSLW